MIKLAKAAFVLAPLALGSLSSPIHRERRAEGRSAPAAESSNADSAASQPGLMIQQGYEDAMARYWDVETGLLGFEEEVGVEITEDTAGMVLNTKAGSELKDIAAQTSTLVDSVSSITPISSLSQITSIQSNYLTLARKITRCASDIKAMPPLSGYISMHLLPDIINLERNIAHLLLSTVCRKELFRRVPLSPVPHIAKVLDSLSLSVDALELALVGIIAENFRSQVMASRKAVKESFAMAIPLHVTSKA